MPGSMDDRQVHVVNASQETVLTVMVYPDGRTMILSDHPKEWVAWVLRQLADTQDPPMDDQPAEITQQLIELTRTHVDEMIKDLERRQDPMTTQQIMAVLGNQANLSCADHRQVLAMTAALLFQRAVYA